jgi:DNA-directed RNA polymerase subunit RPC12/RpoP
MANEAPVPGSVGVEPLRCAGCGGLVPLGQGKTARCPYCHAETPIPEAYDALQRAAKSFAEDQVLARRLYGALGKPPGRIAEALGLGLETSARIGELAGGLIVGLALEHPFGVLLLMAAAYALGFPVAALFRVYYWIAGLPTAQPISPYRVLAVTTVVVALFVVVPLILLRRERAIAGVRRDVHASLAARLPEREGGPSLCRNCGAALDVPRGALGVPCTYCRADNLVALPQAWVERVRATEFKHFLQIDAALEAHRRASEAATGQVWMLAGAMLFLFPLVMAVAWLLVQAKISF